MYQRPRLALSTVATITSTALLLLPSLASADESAEGRRPLPAQAGDFSVKVEPGLALALTRPQSQLFQPGGGLTLKGLFALNPYLGLGPSLSYMALPAEADSSDAGTAWTFGPSLRVQRPHHAPDGDAFFAMSPWGDVDLLYVRTGELNRAGFAAAVGLAVPLGKARVFWLGPFVRYLHILQGTRSGFDNHDAKILSIGLSLEVGSAIRRGEPEPAPVHEHRTAANEPAWLDRDKDTVQDSDDRCPDVAGTADNWGCPAYEKLLVKPDKLELKEKLYFAWDDGSLQEASYPVLDEVVKALKDNQGFRVQVEGHSSSEGTSEHNQGLSERRANAVLDYLVSHGIAKERLVSKGFASSVPSDTNETSAGRENNRRVEFVVNFIILDQDAK